MVRVSQVAGELVGEQEDELVDELVGELRLLGGWVRTAHAAAREWSSARRVDSGQRARLISTARGWAEQLASSRAKLPGSGSMATTVAAGKRCRK